MFKIENLKPAAAGHEPTRSKFHSIKLLITKPKQMHEALLSFHEFFASLLRKETLPDICFPDV